MTPPTPSALPWRADFAEYRGYDCMTDAVVIRDAANGIALMIDVACFGQRPGRPSDGDARQQAMAFAESIVRAVNHHAALVAALQHAERFCPCGARPESPQTHPHVAGCPIGDALAKVQP